MEFPRFIFRVKDSAIEREARRMVESLRIRDIEIRRDETIKDAWLEDLEQRRTIYGLEEIEEYLESLVTGR